jgi:hypothetical protein
MDELFENVATAYAINNEDRVTTIDPFGLFGHNDSTNSTDLVGEDSVGDGKYKIMLDPFSTYNV